MTQEVSIYLAHERPPEPWLYFQAALAAKMHHSPHNSSLHQEIGHAPVRIHRAKR